MKRYIPLKEISTIENKNILFKIEKLIAEEKKEGKEYPIANAYLGYYRALLKEKNNKKLLNLTKELYEFLAFGDKYSLKNNKIADEIRDYFYNKIEEIRKIIIKSYNINSLDLFIEDIKNKYEKSRENKFNDILSKDKYLKQIFKEIDEIYIKYYKRELDLPSPTFSSASSIKVFKKPDSIWILPYSDTITYMLTFKGTYHIQVDTSVTEGLTLFNFEKYI